MLKILLLSLLTLLIPASPQLAEAQQPAKIPRIGFGAATGPDSIVEFRRGLRDLGYIEGKNILIEYRYAEGVAEFPNLVAELVRLKVDVIVVTSTAAAQAAKKATTTIPVIFTSVGDPVGTGVVASLARPGGNVTGFSNLSPELSGKQLELLKEAFPKISHVAVLSETANTGNAASLGEMKVAAEALRVTLQRLEVRGPDDFEPAFSAIKRERASALIVLRNNLIRAHLAQIVGLAIKSGLPALYPDSFSTDAGGLMSYGPKPFEQYRRVAIYVDKILKGAKPAELPVERPTKFEFVINLKTAKQIGVTIPPNVLARADRVIK
jgi:putative tryptophan/tyrosine transport system substrate-binding protein